jgi:hypothetical protein
VEQTGNCILNIEVQKTATEKKDYNTLSTMFEHEEIASLCDMANNFLKPLVHSYGSLHIIKPLDYVHLSSH